MPRRNHCERFVRTVLLVTLWAIDSVNNKPRPHWIIAIDHPARGAEDGGGALDRRAHGASAVEVDFAQQAAFERATAEQPFGADRLVDIEFSTGLEHRHHRAGAGAARGAVELAGAEHVDVLVERAVDGRRVPEGDEVEVVDMGLGRVLDFQLLLDLFASQQAQA